MKNTLSRLTRLTSFFLCLVLTVSLLPVAAFADPVSLYEHVSNKEGEELLLRDQIKDEKQTDERWTDNVMLKNAVEKLSEREKKILYMRYFEGRTQTEISSSVGLSQAQVSRLEKSALKEIRSKIE